MRFAIFMARLVFAVLALVAFEAAAAEGAQATADAESAPGHVVRVGGNYVVASIEKQADVPSSFVIVFKSAQPTGKFDTLRLESDHVHVAVKQGQTLRLSAEILNDKGSTADVSQVLLFLPHESGPVPVWLLSNKAGPRELKAGKYIEMHAPVNDFVVM